MAKLTSMPLVATMTYCKDSMQPLVQPLQRERGLTTATRAREHLAGCRVQRCRHRPVRRQQVGGHGISGRKLAKLVGREPQTIQLRGKWPSVLEHLLNSHAVVTDRPGPDMAAPQLGRGKDTPPSSPLCSPHARQVQQHLSINKVSRLTKGLKAGLHENIFCSLLDTLQHHGGTLQDKRCLKDMWQTHGAGVAPSLAVA